MGHSTSARAATITQSASLSAASFADAAGGDSGPGEDVHSFDLFDPSLGTLDAVTFEVFGRVDGGADLVANGPAVALLPLVASAEVEAFASIENTLDLFDISTSSAVEATLSLFALFGTLPGTEIDTASYNAPIVIPFGPATPLASFIGLGTFDLSLVVLAFYDLLQCDNAISGCSGFNDVTAFADAELTYDYTAVSVIPLPAALPLFGTALAGMGLLGWRRKRKAAA